MRDEFNQFNMTDNESELDDAPSGTVYEYLGFGCSLAMITTSIIGAMGNGCAIWHFGRSTRSSVNVLLTALSAFDLILLLTGTPIYSLLGIYSYDRKRVTLLTLAYCMTVLYPFSNMAQMGSVWTMMLISFDRWLGVCHPFVARRELTVRRARLSVVFVAFVSVVYNLCRFWEYGVEDGLPTPILRSNPIYLSIYVHWMYFAFIFSIPFLVIFVFNVLVMAGVRRATKNRPRCQMSLQQRGERRTTLMLLVVVAIFFACNSLAWLLNGYEMLGYQPTAAAFEFVSDLNNLLVLAHPAFNIIVYFRFSIKFRNEFLHCLCRKKQPYIITPPSSYYHTDNGYRPSVRSKKHAVMDASAIPSKQIDQADQSLLRVRNTCDSQERSPRVSSCTVTTNHSEYSEQKSSNAMCKLIEDEKHRAIGFMDEEFPERVEGTAV